MDRLRHHSRVFFTALFISQVCGFPTFFWSQPDCSQQPSDDSYNSYGSFQGYNYQPPNSYYQGPSYQDTLRGMVDDTVSAVNDIVRVTVTAVKQELVEISKVLYDNFQSKNCNSAVDDGDSSDYNEMNQIVDSPVQIITFPSQSLGTQYTNPVAPQDKIPSNVATWPVLVPRNKTCSNSEGSNLEDKIGNDQTNISVRPSTNHESNNTNTMYVHFPSSSSSPKNTTMVPSSNVSENPAHTDSNNVEFNSSYSTPTHGESTITPVNSSTENMSSSNSASMSSMTDHNMTEPDSFSNYTSTKTNTTSLPSTTNKLTTVNTSSAPPTTDATSAITVDHQMTSTVLYNASSGPTTEGSTEPTDGLTIGVDHVISTTLTTDGSTTDSTESTTFPLDFDVVTTMGTTTDYSSSFTTGSSTERKTQSVLSANNSSQTIAIASPGSFETSTVAIHETSTVPAVFNVTTIGSTSEAVKEKTNITEIRPNEDPQFTPRLDSPSTEATTKGSRNPKL